MTTDMKGIYQRNLFSASSHLTIMVSDQSRYRMLAEVLPWQEMANVANSYRSQKIDINSGRRLDMRKHLGACIAQTMNGWTDRVTEEMVTYHAGVRILCGLESSNDSMDRTSIEKFRTAIGKEAVAELNQIIVKAATGAGFTGSEMCASDTTVQESPIAYPTEVGHMKNISEKILNIGKKFGQATKKKISNLAEKAQSIFTEIRLFARGKAEKAMEKKKKLSKEMQKVVSKMQSIAEQKLKSMGTNLTGRLQKTKEDLIFYKKMLTQIMQWLNTGFHPKEKLLSLWERSARAISKGKVGRAAEFGRRWIVTRLLGGYIIGAPCEKLGADADTSIMDEVIINFLDTFGEVPRSMIYDRGADSAKNHNLVKNTGIEINGIFLKGEEKMNLTKKTFAKVKEQRALTESSIANIKHPKYNFTKPRARSTETCILKGHAAMLGFNLNNLCKDMHMAFGMKLEIT
jgi:transposase, IS5 family